MTGRLNSIYGCCLPSRSWLSILVLNWSHAAPLLLEAPSLAAARLPVCCRLLRMGIQPRLKQDAGSEKFPYVLFSAPPSGSDDYPGEVNI